MNLLSRIIFFSVVIIILGGLQLLVYKTFRNYLKRNQIEGKTLNLITITPFIVFNIPLIYTILTKFDYTGYPKFIYYIIIVPYFIFQASVFFIGLYLLAGKIIKLPFKITRYIITKISYLKKKYNQIKEKKQIQKFDYSRRKFISTSAMFITGYAFIGSTIGVINKDDYEITNLEIKIKNLPESLKGTTIVLISDIHIGPFIDSKKLLEYTEVINRLDSDFIFIAGDLTNSQKEEANELIEPLNRLKSRKGVYAILGNHDYFSDPDYITKVISQNTQVRLLKNEAEIIDINNEKIAILGMEDTRAGGSNYDGKIMEYFEKTLEKAENLAEYQNLKFEKLPKLLLYHKPYFFKYMQNRGIDLIVSGHTHGGQVVLVKVSDFNLSLASAFSPYVSGLYSENGTHMYVSRGIGSVGLPVRLNCSPEITKFTLI